MALHIYEKRYSDFINIPGSELDNIGIYLLDNGMIFIKGKIYGSETQLVNEFPISPIPYIIYVHKTTLEMKTFTDTGWQTIQQEEIPLTNFEILALLQ